jgi:pimeloyl-ACP methyl ester carboxylesterase
LIIGGVSLGGMIACELARRLSQYSCDGNETVPLVKAVLLIASTPTRSGLRPFYRTAGRLWPIIPPGIFRLAKFLAPHVRQFISRAPPSQQRMLLEMFRDQDNRFMHWAVSAILRWRPEPLGTVPIFASKMGLSPSALPSIGHIPLYHIHGDHDRVIPVRPLSPTRIIPHAGHLINLTHTQEVNAFIEEIIARV